MMDTSNKAPHKMRNIGGESPRTGASGTSPETGFWEWDIDNNSIWVTDNIKNLIDITGPGAPILRVTDSGIGIPPEHLARLGEPFYQVDRKAFGSTEGSGLGLALTKRLTEMHGGTLTLESKPGEGTVATVRLPPERVVAVDG